MDWHEYAPTTVPRLRATVAQAQFTDKSSFLARRVLQSRYKLPRRNYGVLG